jgi:hypothetical protein
MDKSKPRANRQDSSCQTATEKKLLTSKLGSSNLLNISNG